MGSRKTKLFSLYKKIIFLSKIIDVIVFCTYQNQQQIIMAEEPERSTQSEPQMYVELNSDQPQDISIGLLETMRSLKADVESIKTDNERLVKVSKEQEELNEILLKNMTEMKKQRHIGQTSSNAKKELSNEESHKRKEYQVNSDKIELLEELK
jgi:hypothetical protein